MRQAERRRKVDARREERDGRRRQQETESAFVCTFAVAKVFTQLKSE